MKIMNYLGFENKTIKKNTKAMRHQRQICAAVSSFHNETSQDVHLFSSKSSNEPKLNIQTCHFKYFINSK